MLRIGIIGAGENTRKKHIPGFRAISGVEIVAVCNRRPESTQAVVNEFGIPRTFSRWQDLVADPNIDAIVIGTWPYLHCPITLAALRAGKHVLTEARMSLNAAEAHQMRDAAGQRPNLVTQIVPSPFGLTGDVVMRELLASGYLGELREYHVFSIQGNLADPESPLSWRQDEVLSGFNMLTLGILHETLLRWLPQPARVIAQAGTFIPSRFDAGLGVRRPAGTPDSVQAITRLPNGARGVYQFSGVVPFGTGNGIRLFGSKGTLFYDLAADRIYGAQKPGPLEEIAIPKEKAGGWRVEADFIDSIRERRPVRFTNFDTGVAYMEFTEAVARSALTGEAVELPLADVEGETDGDSGG
ncbi:MAG TPA: Gfo/Idh/MocA family oxidoreductase [Gemmataceae bacterium]|jgi:predicted dehydrogenase|nr:Gfo/Idh/MocA family oxidoreductase [Gemmataceae bacterium]